MNHFHSINFDPFCLSNQSNPGVSCLFQPAFPSEIFSFCIKKATRMATLLERPSVQCTKTFPEAKPSEIKSLVSSKCCAKSCGLTGDKLVASTSEGLWLKSKGHITTHYSHDIAMDWTVPDFWMHSLTSKARNMSRKGPGCWHPLRAERVWQTDLSYLSSHGAKWWCCWRGGGGGGG